MEDTSPHSSSDKLSPAKFPIPPSLRERTHCTPEQYAELYQQSIKDPEAFWGEQAKRITWFSPWDRVKNCQFQKPVQIRWFENGKLNAAYNCVDRHVEAGQGDTPAIFWEPDEPSQPSRVISYLELMQNVNRVANALKSHGVKKGDRVTLYLPMIPEAIFSILACARIGAVHSVVFAGFSPESLVSRIQDCDSRFLITADEGIRGGKKIPLKFNVDQALQRCPQVKTVFVIKRTGAKIDWQPGRDVWYHLVTALASDVCEPAAMDSEDPLFILYTSGSTGKPKGLVHTTGGYLVYVSLTHELVFDYWKNDVYWCTADIGWITGHSYLIYGPLSNGATVVLFEGTPQYPTSSRHWEIIDRYKVNIYYTAPTLIRSLLREGIENVQSSSRQSLRILGTVGEPINEEAWKWFFNIIGEGRCPIVDTWWQTETGGVLISPLPGAIETKPSSATFPFFGIRPAILNEEGIPLSGEAKGQLVIQDSWPAQARTIYGDAERFFKTYFERFPGMYQTGDGCLRDTEGYYRITGRVDDVLNVSGHRIGTAEIENALSSHPKVSEAGVVGYPHPIKGEGIYAFVTLKVEAQAQPTEDLRNELYQTVGQHLGSFCKPDVIQWASALPKTRSGKIIRRVLKKIAANDTTDLGDLTTLAEPQVIENLVRERSVIN